MSEAKRAAREYVQRGWSVIPVGTNKRPLIEWKEFQSRLPMMKEIDAWAEDAQVGIVTGAVSGLGVIDIDSDKGMAGLKKILPDGFRAPTVHTPRGGIHLYCKYTPAIGNKVGAGIEGVDFRGDGGYVVAPPSMGAGKQYHWNKEANLSVPLPQVPDEYVRLVIRATGLVGEKTWKVADGKMFTEGRRNNDFFHFALRLAKGKADQAEAYAYLKVMADKSGFPDRELKMVIESAFERATREERNLSTEIRNFIDVTDGSFNVKDLSQALNIVNSNDKGTLRVVLHRLRKDGVIDKAGKRDGEYVKVVNEAEEIDWWNADPSKFPVELPLGLSQLGAVHPGGIIAIAGVKDLGKTTVAMNIAIDNVGSVPVRYISSEMDGGELHSRILKWEGVDIEEFKKIKFIRLGGENKLSKLVDPNALNVIDYLEARDGEFYKMGHWISEIYDALRGQRGIAVVCMQKEKGKDYARGGSVTTDRARLYVSLDREGGRRVCRIVSSKNYSGQEPTGMQRYFKIVGGWKILPDGEWGFPVIGGGR
jgi:hypothetical protein